MGAPHIAPEVREGALQAFAAGETAANIAKRLNISASSVWRFARDAQIEVSAALRELGRARVHRDQILKDYRAGVAIETIAERLVGVTPAGVRGVIYEAGAGGAADLGLRLGIAPDAAEGRRGDARAERAEPDRRRARGGRGVRAG